MMQNGYPLVIPPMVSVFQKQVGFMGEDYAQASPSSGAYEGTAVAVYLPIILPAPCAVRRVWWVNGYTVSGGATVEVGVYADSGYGPGVKLLSGSATQGASVELQFVDVTDFSLPPGLVWIALVASTATNTTFLRSAVSGTALHVRLQQSSAYPLPSTATPAVSTSTNIYLFGFATTASP